MFKKILLTIFLSLWLSVLGNPSFAQPNKRITIKGRFDNYDVQKWLKKIGHFEFKLEYELQMWTLMGEPVFMCHVKWDFSENSRIFIIRSEKNTKFNEMRKVKLNSSEFTSIPKLYNIKFLVPLAGLPSVSMESGGDFLNKYVICNGDALGNAGKKNFTTPSSPSWSQTIFDYNKIGSENIFFKSAGKPLGGMEDHYINSEKARKYYKAIQQAYNQMSDFDKSIIADINATVILVEADFNLGSYYDLSAARSNKRKASAKDDAFWQGAVTEKNKPQLPTKNNHDFWSGAIDAGAKKDSESSDFWNGSTKIHNPSDFKIQTIDGKQGVSTKLGRVLIPYRKWHIQSYKDGMAKVSIKSGKKHDNACSYAFQRGWKYYVRLSEEGIVNVTGNWILPIKKTATGGVREWAELYLSGPDNRTEAQKSRADEKKQRKSKDCKSRMEREMQAVFNQYRSQGYTIVKK